MVKEVLLACVGKPSAGKSSFLNAGNYEISVDHYPLLFA